MRQGPFEVTVIAVDRPDETLPEVEFGPETYVVAEPNKMFMVQFTVYNDGYQRLPEALRVDLSVDGRKPDRMCRKVVFLRDDLVTVTFLGFAAASDGTAYSPFLFDFPGIKPEGAEAAAAAAASGAPVATERIDAGVAGTLTIDVYDTVLRYEPELPPESIKRIARAPAINMSGAEGGAKKMAGSLTTRGGDAMPNPDAPLAGRRRPRDELRPTYYCGAHMSRLTMRYQTVSWLVLKGILRRDVPEHRVLLPPDMLRPAPGAVIVLDADRPQRPDEVLLCDLTEEDAPQWQSKRREVAEVRLDE